MASKINYFKSRPIHVIDFYTSIYGILFSSLIFWRPYIFFFFSFFLFSFTPHSPLFLWLSPLSFLLLSIFFSTLLFLHFLSFLYYIFLSFFFSFFLFSFFQIRNAKTCHMTVATPMNITCQLIGQYYPPVLLYVRLGWTIGLGWTGRLLEMEENTGEVACEDAGVEKTESAGGTWYGRVFFPSSPPKKTELRMNQTSILAKLRVVYLVTFRGII